MPGISCTLDEFYSIIGPKIRNDVATVTKQKKNQLFHLQKKQNFFMP